MGKLDELIKAGPPVRGFNPPPDVAAKILEARELGIAYRDIITALAGDGITVSSLTVLRDWCLKQKRG